ncbi:hypothetical protein V7O62_04900 [Methanolobus sp. ZRKC2]|uniref:mechanosensitive ion channel family protein n=1 Tax=Methanolobus sp. ZRKC2 TaxID=3125783 RepID=UPI00324311FC
MSESLTGSVYVIANDAVGFLPTLLAVIILIIVGWIAGRALGKIGANFLDRIGLDDLILKTSLGTMFERTNVTVVEFFDAAIRWFIYIIFAVIIIDLLNVEIVADFLTEIILYIPIILAALVVLIIGLLVTDFIAGLVKNVTVASGADERIESTSFGAAMKTSGLTFSGLLAAVVKLFGYLVFILAALDILNLPIIAVVVGKILAYLPNLFAGILILVVGLLAIDLFADYIGEMMKNMDVEGSDIWISALRGFLALVVVLLTLDALLIDTTIFYILLEPLAWGIAIVVAFRWGIKEAMVAYAKAKK